MLKALKWVKKYWLLFVAATLSTILWLSKSKFRKADKRMALDNKLEAIDSKAADKAEKAKDEYIEAVVVLDDTYQKELDALAVIIKVGVQEMSNDEKIRLIEEELGITYADE